MVPETSGYLGVGAEPWLIRSLAVYRLPRERLPDPFEQARGRFDDEGRAVVVVPFREHAGVRIDVPNERVRGVGDEEFGVLRLAFEELDDEIANARDVGGIVRRDHDRLREFVAERLESLGIDAIPLVEEDALLDLSGADAGEDLAGDGELIAKGRIGRVHEIEQERRFEGFVQRRTERRDEFVGELLDETDGIADEDARFGLGLERAYGGVEGREQLVGDVDVGAGQRAHQR